MIVVADSGLTKTDWRVVLPDKTVIPFETKGLSPFFCHEDDYVNALTSSFPSNLDPNDVSEVFFYGSGCAGDEKGFKAKQSLQLFFVKAGASAYSDLLAAARSLFGDGKGTVAILGTGSNVAFYNGQSVNHVTPSLGFILGDEGSGASIGRQLIQAYFYGQLPEDLSRSLSDRYNLELSHVLDRIYSQPKPSAYLASFVPFVKENISNKFLSNMMLKVFEDLYEYHLKVIPELGDYGLGVVGSVGFVFKDIMLNIAEKKGFEIKEFLQYPIDSLTKYHIQKYS
jgi:glucosamine kinase